MCVGGEGGKCVCGMNQGMCGGMCVGGGAASTKCHSLVVGRNVHGSDVTQLIVISN